ncbi:hypothetical protein HPB51_011318 [Rhipicephalus microplus]|uniref:Uncharacterized protein n=1 Tax=Rhipicephalus microplus TaxID=6941 RepID=A0A9J6DM04_RHIMP|nr:hypothetical protein HPB51_011318 [Rhipicephalus microplus]
MSALIFLPRGESNRNSSNKANRKRVRTCVRVSGRGFTLHLPRLPKGGAASRSAALFGRSAAVNRPRANHVLVVGRSWQAPAKKESAQQRRHSTRAPLVRCAAAVRSNARSEPRLVLSVCVFWRVRASPLFPEVDIHVPRGDGALAVAVAEKAMRFPCGVLAALLVVLALAVAVLCENDGGSLVVPTVVTTQDTPRVEEAGETKAAENGESTTIYSGRLNVLVLPMAVNYYTDTDASL